MKYFNVKKPRRYSPSCVRRSSLDDTGGEFETLGVKILRSFELGADLGAKIAVNYDDENSDDVDVLTSPNHDFFDIAEEFQQMVEQTPAPQPKPAEPTNE